MSIIIIAELGINHNGDIEIAKELIDVAVDAGANLVKFQKRTIIVNKKRLNGSHQLGISKAKNFFENLI